MITSLDQDLLNSLSIPLPILKEAIAVIPLSGLTNQNYRIDTLKERFVLRLHRETTHSLGINRAQERINTQKAFEIGIGAPLVAVLPHENVLLMRWIEGNALNMQSAATQPHLLPKIAQAMKTLHTQSSPFEGRFYFPEIRKKYLETVLQQGYFLPEGYLEREAQVLELEKALAATAEPFVPCHNDLYPANMIDDGSKIWLIDYEYSGQNEASFDIGNFVSTGLNETQIHQFCEAYWGAHLPHKVARAQAWAMIALYGLTMWSSIQEAVSTISFDFRASALNKWNKILPQFQSAYYKNVLNQL